MNLKKITDNFVSELNVLFFQQPVQHVYNPLEYARKPFDLYCKKYGNGPKEIILIGMNPGPWGMVQNGIPFGEITAVKEWLGIKAPVTHTIDNMHPKRPIIGFDCTRREVSGKRLWGWAQNRFGTPDNFFDRFFVVNYCPLAFFDNDGKNVTPDKLKKDDREKIYATCDLALKRTIEYLKPKHVIGIGNFAEMRALNALKELENLSIGRISHPSPASPKANKGWEKLIEGELKLMGITF